MNPPTERMLEKAIQRYHVEHSSYKYWRMQPREDRPELCDATLYWHIISYDDFFQLVHCPLTNYVEASSLTENPLERFFQALYVSPGSLELASFSAFAPRCEERLEVKGILNPLHPQFEVLRQAARMAPEFRSLIL